MTTNYSVEDLLQQIASAPKVVQVAQQVSLLEEAVSGLPDEEILTLLKGLDPVTVYRIGHHSPKLVLRIMKLIEKRSENQHSPDDNRYERVYSEE